MAIKGLFRCLHFDSPLIGEAHADTSSGAVEIYAAGNATQDILSLSYVVEEMGLDFPYPFVLELGNMAAKIFADGSAQRSKLKHIDARQEWVRTLRNRRVCIPKHIPTAENAAGMLTKILPWKIVLTLRNMVLFPYKQPGI